MASSLNPEPLSSPYPRREVTGVVLAGGRARRMGGADKGLVAVNGEAMVTHALRGLRPQVSALFINANRNQERYAALGDCKVIADADGDYAGPLAGMASAMQHATTRYILTVPCDSPLLAPNLGQRLFAALAADHGEISVAHDGTRMQPVFALLDCALRESIVGYLSGGGRKIDAWYAQRRLALADFADYPEMFLNINTPEDRDSLEKRLAGQDRC